MKKLLSIMLAGVLASVPAVAVPTAPVTMKESLKTGRSGMSKKTVCTNTKPFVPVTPMPGYSNLSKFTLPAGMAATHKSAPKRPSARRAVAEGIPLRGNVIQQSGWTSETSAPGIYTIPVRDGEDFSVCKVADLNGGGYDNNEGVYRGVYYFELFGRYYTYVYTYNSKTWERTEALSGAEITIAGTDCAMDPLTGDVYGCYFNSYRSGYVWAKADYETGKSMKISDIATPGKTLIAVGADKNGQFYAISKESVLYKVEKTTGALTEIAQTELPVQYLAGGCINDENNTFLVTFCTDEQTGLCEIDLATGATTLINEFTPKTNVIGLHVYHPAAHDKAPDKPELSITCPDGMMTANYTITMPDKLFDGTDAGNATFRWELTANGTLVAMSNLRAGQTTSGSVDLTESGMNSFILTCANDAGQSPKARATCYIGKGTPAAPSGVTLSYDNASSTATLNWDGVTSASDEGYFDANDVTYSVYDMNGICLSDNITATTLDIPLDAPEEYTIFRYKVTASHGGKSSPATLSNKIGLGSYALPHAHAFDTPQSLDEYIVVDANNDGSTWGFTERSATGNCAYYIYSDKQGDDWLFTPAFRMEAGKIYEVTAMAGSFSTFMGTESLEIKAGTGASPEKMTIEVLPPIDLEWQTVEPISGWVRPTETGVYTIGFHAISKPDQWMMKINSYEVSGPRTEMSPDTVAALSVIPAADGDLKALITFTAPCKTVTGNEITGNLTVKISRDGIALPDITVAAGAEYSFTDNVTAKGEYHYIVTPFSADGSEGRYATATAYIGPNPPANPAGVKVVETDNTGHVTVSWTDAPEDIYGNTIETANLSYNIWQYNDEAEIWDKKNETPVKGNTFAFDALTNPQQQKFIQIKVTAINRDEENSDGTPAHIFAAGKPYDIPASLSANDEMFDRYIFSADSAGGGEIGIGSSELGVPASDGDDAYFVITSSTYDNWASFMTGKFNLAGAEYPVVSFMTLKIADDDVNVVSVSVLCDGVIDEVLSTIREDIPAGSWSKIKINLANYAGKSVQLIFKSTIKAYSMTLIDAISITDDVRNDVAVTAIDAPSVADTGDTFPVTVTVLNDGALAADNVGIELYKDNRLAETKTISTIQPGENIVVTFDNTLLPTDGEEVTYQARAIAANDEIENNNTSTPITVNRNLSTFPTVTGVAGSVDETGINLAWESINADALPADAQLTDFEDGTAWASEYGGWTFVDIDGGEIGGMQGSEIPEHPVQSKASFWVFDASDTETWNKTFTAHSGSKYLVSMFNYDDSTVDDWAISPLLDGHAQMVEFFANSYSELYPEEIEVWYATANTVNPAEFVKLESFGRVKVPSLRGDDGVPTWTRMRFRLPEGAMRFAMRSNATGAFMLMLDDFTFAKAGGESTLRLTGYNIYRNSEKINDLPLTEAAYHDATPVDGTHTYHVTAVYDRGESEVSEPVSFTYSGVELPDGERLYVGTDHNDIIVKGAGNDTVTVYNAAGQTIAATTGDLRVTVPEAIYLVTVGQRSFKLIVR